jgi:hypothetical protein
VRATRRPRPTGAARRIGRTGVALAAVTALSVTLAGTGLAATTVTVRNLGGLKAAGPVNTEYGLPAWYEDSQGVRLEPCLDNANPLCAILPDEVPNPDAPISFPDNFPAEFFYQLVDSSIDLPGGGRAVLTLGLEAAWANDVVQNGDQIVFARTRVVVKDGPANETLTFKHPFGELTVDTDGTGDGRLVEDISPSIGNFTAALKGNYGPFLRWDPAVAPAAPEGYMGDPGRPHAVVGSPLDYNEFSTVVGGTTIATDQFTVSGKIATNTGVTADLAVVNGGFIDVFATSRGEALQVDGQDGTFVTTPMASDGTTSERHYARIALSPTAPAPTEVTIRNIGDDPPSTSVFRISGLAVSTATYDGTKLTVAATASAPAGYPVEVVGIGTLENAQPKDFTVSAPPAVVTVRSGPSTATFPVTIAAGGATTAQPPVTPQPDAPPRVETGTGGGTTDPAPALTAVAGAAQTTLVRGASTTLDGSASIGAAGFAWRQLGGTPVEITGVTTARPTVKVPFFAATADTGPRPAPTATGPAVIELVVTDAAGAASAPATVSLEIPQDTLAIVAGARHRLSKELRIDGTSAIQGNTAVLAPPTTVVVYDTTPGTNGNPRNAKLGTAQVDTLGNWSLRLRPGPARQVTAVAVQSSRGGTITATLAR